MPDSVKSSRWVSGMCLRCQCNTRERQGPQGIPRGFLLTLTGCFGCQKQSRCYSARTCARRSSLAKIRVNPWHRRKLASGKSCWGSVASVPSSRTRAPARVRAHTHTPTREQSLSLSLSLACNITIITIITVITIIMNIMICKVIPLSLSQIPSVSLFSCCLWLFCEAGRAEEAERAPGRCPGREPLKGHRRPRFRV